jgi:hypothetical protein
MLEPERYYYRDARGLALARKNRPEEAIREFQLFLSVRGNSIDYGKDRGEVIKELKTKGWRFTPDFLVRHFAD